MWIQTEDGAVINLDDYISISVMPETDQVVAYRKGGQETEDGDPEVRGTSLSSNAAEDYPKIVEAMELAGYLIKWLEQE